MAKKFTPWFTSAYKPARRGVYQVESKVSRLNVYQHWDGKVWALRSLSPQNAALHAGRQSSLAPHPTWRGLAADPKVAA